MNIYGFQKSTLLDYPEHLAATIFTGSCNFRCPFCHNGQLVLSPNTLSIMNPDDTLSYLKKRRTILEGVCITGGEPTLQPDLRSFLVQIKSLGYKVKLDTNGYRPKVLHSLLTEHLLDYVAMDIKNSPQKYRETAGLSTMDMGNIEESIHLLKTSTINYEFRTTVVKEFHSHTDIKEIATWLRGNSFYYLQSYKDAPDLIEQGYHAHDTKTLSEFLAIAKQQLPNAALRGVDLSMI